MRKTISLGEAVRVSEELKKQGKTVVLVGGCFDILHKGHLLFLEQAEKQGDALFVALENDESVRKLKGEGRPVNDQKARAGNLARLDSVDYVILLPLLVSNNDYFELTKKLAPDIIAITEGDPKRAEKESQGNVVVVTKHLTSFSTTKILQNL